MSKRTNDPATGRFVRQRADDSPREQQPAQEADTQALQALFNSEYDDWQERSQENEERMRMEREDEDAARPSRMRICINGASSNLRDSDIYDNDDQRQQPAFDPNEAGPSQPVSRRIVNLARLQGKEMEQMDARHREEAARPAKLTAELAETHRGLSASLEACPPSSRSEEDDHNPDAEAFVDAEMTDAEMNHAYEQHVPIPSVDQTRLIRSSVHFQSMVAAAPVADRPELVRSSSAGASRPHRVANRGQTFQLENLVLLRIPEPHGWRNRDSRCAWVGAH